MPGARPLRILAEPDSPESPSPLARPQALMEYSPDEAKVLRDGRAQKIHAVDLVPGDVITLAVGDKVPADSRVLSISSASFTVDQALLTGESYSVSKSTGVVADPDAVKQDMTNMLFSVSRRADLVERSGFPDPMSLAKRARRS